MFLSRKNILPEVTLFSVAIIILTLILILFQVKFFSLFFPILIFFVFAFFLISPQIGFFLMLILRPLLDVFTAETILSIDRLSLNVSSLLAVAVIIATTISSFRYWDYLKKTPLKKIWWLFLSLAFFSIAYSVNIGTSFSEWIRYLSFYCFFILGFMLIQNTKDFTKLLLVIAHSGIIPAFFAIYQFITEKGMTLPLEGITNRIYGTFAHPNPLAYYLVFLIAILVYLIIHKKGVLLGNYLMLFLYSLILLLTFTRGAWLALIATLFIVGVIKFRKLLMFLIVFLIIIYVAIEPIRLRVNALGTYDPNSSIEWRKGVWKDGLEIAKGKIIFGHGAGTAQGLILEARGPEAGSSDPHNDYLKILIENGLIGLTIYLFLIFFLLYNLVRKYLIAKNTEQKDLYLILFSFSLAIFIMSFGDNILRSTVLQWALWAVIGGALALKNIQKDSR